jgi:dCTP diphosphatase
VGKDPRQQGAKGAREADRVSTRLRALSPCVGHDLDRCRSRGARVHCYREAVSRVELRQTLREFVAERDWSQFHTPENLAKSISIEAAELLECFQWDPSSDVARVQEELADVLTYCYLLADRIGSDPEELIRRKLATTREKYPVERARGRSTKYDQL